MERPQSVWKSRSATACAWFVGLVFLLTGFAKAYDMWGFIEKAKYYRSIDVEYIQPLALGTIALELLLGWALCMRVAPRVVAGFSLFVVVCFTGAILYTWKVYGIEDCGCLGVLAETPPGFSVVKNVVLMGALAWVAWVPGARFSTRRGLVGLASSLLLALGCAHMLSSQT